jgi:hypothetical protein
MTDVPFVISALFSKTVQTAPYESEKAEISAQCKVEDGADAQASIEFTMSMVRKQVMIALGKEAGTLVAVAADPQKRGPGRPRKEVLEADAKARQEGKNLDGGERRETNASPEPEAEKTVEKAAPQPVPQDQEVIQFPGMKSPDEAEDEDFGDPKDKVVEAISDKQLQAACAAASKKPGMDAAKVKKLFNTKYGTTLVAKIKPEERKDFLSDLAALVEANKPKE